MFKKSLETSVSWCTLVTKTKCTDTWIPRLDKLLELFLELEKSQTGVFPSPSNSKNILEDFSMSRFSRKSILKLTGQISLTSAQTVGSNGLMILEWRELLVSRHFPNEESLGQLEDVEDELLQFDSVRLLRLHDFTVFVDVGDLLVCTMVWETR
ncbi:hypothetical protein GCK72_011145 [Caenorhabditis remanei]|uniref:Uncharacterized protein n=1 Tax=Caenorhabditis remanei TaxID=31234 RepID=A0A6A5H7P3_CAERE|nr:hypothetical protein GCK72_011145 [Caenorhabditis remanei]KAF1762881.1 hypothetical protein GCK72_011145 [Caenorhabditis remanei]